MRFSRIFSRILKFFSRCLLWRSYVWAVATSTRAPLKPERKAVILTEMDGDVLGCSSASLLKLVPALFPLPTVEGEMGPTS